MDTAEAKRVVFGNLSGKIHRFKQILTVTPLLADPADWEEDLTNIGQECRRLSELLDPGTILELDAQEHDPDVHTLYLFGVDQSVDEEFRQFFADLDLPLGVDKRPNIAQKFQKYLPGLSEACQDKLLEEIQWFYAQKQPPLTKPLRRKHLRRYLTCKHFGLEQEILTKAAEQLVMSYWSGWLGAEFSSGERTDEEMLALTQKIIATENIGVARLEQLVQNMTADLVESSEVEGSTLFVNRVKDMKLRLPALTALQLVPPIQKYLVQLAASQSGKEERYYTSVHSETEKSLPPVIQLLEELVSKSDWPNFVLLLAEALREDHSEWGWPFYGTWIAESMKKLGVSVKLVRQFGLSYKQREVLVKELAGPPEFVQEIELEKQAGEERLRAWHRDIDEKVAQGDRQRKKKLTSALDLLRKSKK